MSKRCELQKEYYQANGNYKGNGKYNDDYVRWLEDQILALRIHDVIKSVCDCSSETFAHHYKGGDKCGYCGGKAES
jgi:hypothetical protein